jgi:hypothetical protein
VTESYIAEGRFKGFRMPAAQFPPPYAELAFDPSKFEYFWRSATYAFELPDPKSFPPFTVTVSDEDLRTAHRFIESCRELASYETISADFAVSISKKDGVASHTTTQISREQMRGTAVLFRQLHGTDRASYNTVLSILSRLIERTDDGRKPQRRAILQAWRGAHGALQQRTVDKIVQDKIYHPAGSPRDTTRNTPTELLASHFNGDLIHWGNRRDEHESHDVFERDMRQLDFLRSLGGLAHFYFGFSLMLAQGLSIET